MSDPALKPWSQVDDDSEDESLVSGAPVSAASPSGQTQRVGQQGRRMSLKALNERLSDWRVSLHWPLVPMSVCAAWILWDVIFSPSRSVPVFHALAILTLTVLSVALVVLARMERQGAIARILTAIQDDAGQASRVLGELPVEPELYPILKGIEDHAGNVERRVEELLETNRKSTLELTLAETQRKQAAGLIDAISAPLLLVDGFGQLSLANPAAERVFGFSRGEMVRRSVDEFIEDEPLLLAIQRAREADARAAERHGEHEIGERVFASSVMSLIQLREEDRESEAGHGVLVMLRDITKEHEASKKKSEFVSHVAHELRTPLASITAYVEMLVDGEASDEETRSEYYDIIQTSADRLGRLIDNMLNISRIEAGTVRINKEATSVAVLVKEVVDTLRPQAEEKKITLEEDLPPVIYRVMADRDLIYQAVLNLISNAIKYTPEGGRVSVTMIPNEENRTMLIQVKDTGVGIPQEDLPKMFQKFFRVEANKKIAKGTGLGLNLVKNVVEVVHGGKMSLSSEVGKGSTFGMTLPLMS